MTRGELRNLALYWLDDLQAGYFTETQMNVWLNNAQYEVQKQLLNAGQYWYLKCASTQTIAGTQSIALPPDFLKNHRLELQVPGTASPNIVWNELTNMTLNEGAILNVGGQGQPCAYTIGKDCLILWSVPDIVYSIKLHYSYRVDPMTDDLNVPDCPLQYHEYIAVMAAADGFLKDGRDPSVVYAKRDYYVDMMKKDDIQRDRAQPRRVRYRSDDGGSEMMF